MHKNHRQTTVTINLRQIATDVAILKDKAATKEDIANVKVDFHKDLNNQTWKIISVLFIAVLLAVLSHYFIK
ncbi:hypothetical protein GPD55_004265 [Salmonella enterica]|nr:hypothetical protein [Salmonella enterica]